MVTWRSEHCSSHLVERYRTDQFNMAMSCRGRIRDFLVPQCSLHCLLQSSPKCQALYTFCFFWTDACGYAPYLTGGAKVARVVTDARSALASPSAVTQLLVFGHAVFSSLVAAAVLSHPVLVAYAPIAQTLPVTTAESAREETSWCQHAVVCEKQDGLKQLK